MPKLQNLPQLNLPELPSVTSKVVDTFIPAKERPQNPVIQDLINSLSGFGNSLTKYQLVQEETKKFKDEAQAKTDFELYLKNKDEFKSLIQQKIIPQGASPYYINELAKAQLKQDAREYKSMMYDEWVKSNVYRDDDPSAFDQWFQTKSQEFYTNKKLNSYNPATLADSFLPDANALYAELNQINRSKQIAEIERLQKELLFKETNNQIEDAFKINPEDLATSLSNFPNASNLKVYQQRLLYASGLIQKKLDELTAAGMDYNEANKTIVDAVVNYAKQTENPDYLNILDNIITDKASGSKLGDTTYASDETIKASDYILTNNRQNLQFNSWYEKEQLNKFNKLVNEDFYTAFRENPLILKDAESWIKKWEEDNNFALPLETYDALITSKDVLLNALNNEDVVRDEDLIRELEIDVINEPRRDGLQNEIITAIQEKKIPYNEGIQLIEKMLGNFDLGNSIYLTDPLYKYLENSFEAQLDANTKIETPKNKVLRLNTILALKESAYIFIRNLDPALSDAQNLAIFQNFMKERTKDLLDAYVQGYQNKTTELDIKSDLNQEDN